jgi:hypothetical protein
MVVKRFIVALALLASMMATVSANAPAVCRAFDCRAYVRAGLHLCDPLGDEAVTAAGKARLWAARCLDRTSNDPPSLNLSRLRASDRLVLEIDIRQRLSRCGLSRQNRRLFFDGPGRREAALIQCEQKTRPLQQYLMGIPP